MNGSRRKTKRPFVISEPWDIVIVPFPFTESAKARRRPALILSAKAFNENGFTILAMITTKAHHPWPADTDIREPGAAGLTTPCIIRMKLFTLDNRLLMKKIGRLSTDDRHRVTEQIRRYFTPLTP